MEAGKIILVILILLLLALAFFLLKTRLPGLRFFIENLNGSAVILLLLLIAVVVVLLCRALFGPKGPASIFHEKESAFDSENAENEVDSGETEGNEAGFSWKESLVTGAGGDSILYITVTEDTVKAGETFFSEPESFREALRSLREEKITVCLVDDYARADRYHEVEKILRECGFEYLEQEKP